MKLETKFKKMFKCDTVRISKPLNELYLIIGTKKNTKNDKGSIIYKNNKIYNFEYVDEHVIASGKNEVELMKSAKYYKKLLKLGNNWDKYFKDKVWESNPDKESII